MKLEMEGIMGLQALKVVQQPGKLIVWLLISVTFLIACKPKPSAQLPYYHSADFTPHWADRDNFSVDTIHAVAPFQFTDQESEIVSNATVKNKIYVANFFFTICPGICPKMNKNLASVVEVFKDNNDVLFISHSVTPHIDSVAQLKKYATENNIPHRQWKLVTGDKESIYSLARQSYFAEQEIGFQNSTDDFLHTEHLILVDRNGHIRGIYKGTLVLETERLIEDIHLLLNE